MWPAREAWIYTNQLMTSPTLVQRRFVLARIVRIPPAYTHLLAKPAHLHPDKLLLYRKFVGTHLGVELKGSAVPYTSMNGSSLGPKPASKTKAK